MTSDLPAVIERAERSGRRAEARVSARRVTVRSFLAGLRTAYRTGGIPRIRDLHRRTRSARMSVPLRVLLGGIEGSLPLPRLLELGAEFDAALGRTSLPSAAASTLTRGGAPWTVDVRDEDRGVLRDAPLVVFGNHPSMLTPLLVFAALGREDVRMVAYRYLGRLLPRLAPYLLPVDPTFRRTARAGLREGLTHLVTLGWLHRLDEVPSPDEARIRNRQTVEAATEHVRRGGAVVAFPNAGREGGRWLPGIGSVIAGLLAKGDMEEIRVVAIREENSSNRRVYRLLSPRRSPSRIRRRDRTPIRIRLSEPLPLSALGLPNDAPPAEIVAALKDRYGRMTSPHPTRDAGAG